MEPTMNGIRILAVDDRSDDAKDLTAEEQALVDAYCALVERVALRIYREQKAQESLAQNKEEDAGRRPTAAHGVP